MYTIGIVVGQVASIILVPIYTRIFSPADYGVIDLTFSLTGLLIIALPLGVDEGMGRYYADELDPRERVTTVSTALLYLATISIVFALVLIVLSARLAEILLGSRGNQNVIVFASLGVPFLIVGGYIQRLFRWRMEPARFTITTIAAFFFQVALTLYLVAIVRVGVSGIFSAIIISGVVFCVVNGWLTRDSFGFSFSWNRLGKLLHFGAPLVVAALGFQLLTYMDRYFIEHFCGLREVGLYGISYRIAGVLMLVTRGIQLAIGPHVYSTYKDQNSPQRYARLFDYSMVAIVVGVMALSLFSSEGLVFLAPRSYSEAYVTVPLLAGSAALYVLGSFFTFGLGIGKRSDLSAACFLGAVAVNALLNRLLIPSMGYIGAGYATIVAFAFLAVLQMLVSQKLYYVPYRFGRHIILYSFAAVIIAVAYGFLMSKVTLLNFLLKFLLLVGFIFVPFVIGLVEWSDVRVQLRHVAQWRRNRPTSSPVNAPRAS